MLADQLQIKQITRKIQTNTLLSQSPILPYINCHSAWWWWWWWWCQANFEHIMLCISYFYLSPNKWRQNQISTATNALAIICGFYHVYHIRHLLCRAQMLACCEEENQLNSSSNSSGGGSADHIEIASIDAHLISARLVSVLIHLFLKRKCAQASLPSARGCVRCVHACARLFTCTMRYDKFNANRFVIKF